MFGYTLLAECVKALSDSSGVAKVTHAQRACEVLVHHSGAEHDVVVYEDRLVVRKLLEKQQRVVLLQFLRLGDWRVD